METTTLHLAKQNFKFSSAHFLIFDQHEAEMLHGHNYRVEVDIEAQAVAPANPGDDLGYFVDFNDLKKVIKAQCDEWDEHVLLPGLHPDMKYKTSSDGKNYEIHFRDRFYSLPVKETIWLPVHNTSVEQLSKLLAQDLMQKFKIYKIAQIRVSVEETAGQGASTTVRTESLR